MSNDNKDCKNSKDSSCENKIESCLFSLPPKQFALLSSIIGILLIDDLDIDQQNALGNFITGIGQTIMTAAAQQQLQENTDSPNDQILNEIENLKNQISLLKKEIENQNR